jgi:WD40 repeat protein
MNRSPFKFLEAYGAQDKHLFFGRDQEIETLFNLTFRSRFILVYGPSGTGKTSLIRSGLAKKLSDTDWFSIYIRRKNDINASLREEVGKWDRSPNTRSISEQVRYVSLLYLRPVYLLFDQLEELFISGDAQEQYDFLQNLIQLYQSDVPCKIILSMREEYLAHLYSFEEALPSLFDYRLRVEQMGDERIREVIIQTFEALPLVKLDEPACADAIVENLKEPRKLIQLPYLQVYLDRLWNSAVEIQQPKSDDEVVVINRAMIEDVGRINEVLEEYLEEQITRVQTEITDLSNRPGFVHKLLDSFVTADGTRKNVNLTDFPDDKDKLLRVSVLTELEKRRILREDNGIYEFFHDSLAGVIFKKRSSEQKRLAGLIRRLKQAYADFESNAQHPDFYLNKLSSQEFRVNEACMREELTESEFSAISTFIAQGEQFREAERIGKEMEKRHRRRVLVNLSILLTVVVALGSLAMLQWQKSLISNLISLSSNLILKANPEDALTLAWQAHQTLPNSTTERALLSAFNEYDSPDQWAEVVTEKLDIDSLNRDDVQGVSVSDDDQLALIIKTKTLESWTTTGQKRQTIRYPKGFLSANFCSDNQTIMAVTQDSLVHLWDADGKKKATLLLKQPVQTAFALPTVNPLVVSLSDNDQITVWTTDGEMYSQFRNGLSVEKFFYSTDGKQLFVVATNGTVKVWSVRGELGKTVLFKSKPTKIVCSPTTEYCAVLLADNTVHIGEFKQPKSWTILRKIPTKVLDIAFDSDGQTLAVMEEEFILSRWNVNQDDAGKMRIALATQNKVTSSHTACNFSPDAHWLVSEIANYSERGMSNTLFNLKGKPIKTLFGFESFWRFSSSSKLIVSVEKDSKLFRIWERKGRLRTTLAAHEDAVYRVAFTPDSLYLLTASGDGETQKWDFNQRLIVAKNKYDGLVRDIATPHEGTWLVCFDTIARFKDRAGVYHNIAHDEGVVSGDISLDGRFFVTASGHKATLWNEMGKKIHEFLYKKTVNRAIFSPDGTSILVACDDSTAQLWSSKSFQLLQTFNHNGAVSYAAFSPNFRRPLIITTSADSTAKVWDTEGNELLTIAHNSFVSSGAISADNQTILTTTNSGLAQLWNQNRERKAVFEVNNSIMHAVFSPNEQSVVIACEDGSIQLWPTLKNIRRWAAQDSLGDKNILLKPHISFLKDKYQVTDSIWEDFLALLTDLYRKSTIHVHNWSRQLKLLIHF